MEIIQWEYKGRYIPLRLHVENRKSIRFSIVKNGLNIRIPKFLNQKERINQIEIAKNWLSKQLEKDKNLLPPSKSYLDGDSLSTWKDQFLIRVKQANRKSVGGRLKNGVIEISQPLTAKQFQVDVAVKQVLSRLLAAHYLPDFERRIHHFNQLYFQKEIKKVRLKHNRSNWGSCSNSGNINLSTRLFFAPEDVQNYVIVHELAHLLEMNHGPRFWKLVEGAFPAYREKEQWLKENSSTCNF